MKIAIIHDWLVTKAGSEAVLEQLLLMYPGADVFTLVNFLNVEDSRLLNGSRCFTSFIQNLPFAQKHYRSYLPLMPLAIEQFDVSGYDVVISSSHAVAKGVITGPDQVHLSYVHSPMRYAWDLQHMYLREAKMEKGIKSTIARIILHYMRVWDARTVNGVDYFIANSNFIARRIKKCYARKAEVIYPPVQLDEFVVAQKPKEDFYLTVSRFVPYKKIPLIVEAFARMPDKRLVVIGDGPEHDAARQVAGPHIEFLGRQSRSVVIDYMQRAKAFVFAAEEDFGIVPVEAQGCGTPVIAYGKGGALETVVDGKTGVFFAEQTTTSLIDAVKRFESLVSSFDKQIIRSNAERFEVGLFRYHFNALLEQTIRKMGQKSNGY
ncbi:MAG: glycosyltransferase family 4 protein [Alphaproteobacteria bacterium]|nr:glycosyltransferase family 4 protein [Alphaproteobacteria bacterium]